MTLKESPSPLSVEAPGTFSTVKGVIFDIDGTLVDSWKLGFDATQVVLENNGIPTITEESYHECTRYATPERLARHAGLLPNNGYEFEEVGAKLAQEFDDLYVGLVDRQTAGFYRGMHELFANLPPNVSLGALTNACAKYAHAVLKVNAPSAADETTIRSDQRAIYDRFCSIRGADNVPSPKPAPDGLWVCCKEMDLAPEDCVYVGDSPSDAVAAQAAGMPSIGVLWGSHSKDSLRKAPFTHLCRSVEELQELLPKPVAVVAEA